MTTELTTTAITLLALIICQTDRSPALVYLARLAESSRRPQRQSLQAIASLVKPDATVETFPWHGLRYQHT